MKPRCNDDLKRSDTLSHNTVLSNSPELPKRLCCKSRRNQMREKSITSLSSTVSALAELLKQDAALRGVFGEAEGGKRRGG